MQVILGASTLTKGIHGSFGYFNLSGQYTYYKSCIAGLPLPLAWVDWDLLQKNLAFLLDKVSAFPAAPQKTIRIATKSIRSAAILKKILNESPVFHGVLCYSPCEAVYLSEQGIDDILIAYPTLQKQAIGEICKRLHVGASVTFMVDCIAQVEAIEAVSREQGVVAPLCIDLDMATHHGGIHFGVWRSPLATSEQVGALLDFIRHSPHVRVEGAMGYEAQLAGVGDNHPNSWLKNKVIRFLKKRSSKEVLTRRKTLVEIVKGHNPSLRFVNGGGTGSLDFSLGDTTLTEVTVGSLFFGPVLFDYYQDLKLQPAAGFAIELTRKPGKSFIWTGFGGGYTASGVFGKDKMPEAYLPKARLTATEGAGEVQTPIIYKGPEDLSLGDPVFLRHAKAGELCERFRELHMVSKGSVVEKVTTYRGDGKCFG